MLLSRLLDYAIARARKRLLEVHFEQAMELVDRMEGEVEPRRALDVYARLHRLTALEASYVMQEVFVALGARPRDGDVVVVDDPQPNRLEQMRRRLRGRVNLELRRWVEYHSGRTETALFRAHLENAHEFVDLLDSRKSISEAVAYYAEQVDLSPSWREMIYFLILDRRSPEPEGTPAGLLQKPSLRILEGLP